MNDASARPSRQDSLWLVVLAIGLGAACAAAFHPWFDRANDASFYVLTARALAAGEGYTYLGEPFLVRPPGLAWLLAPWVGASPPMAIATINGLLLASGALACVLAWFYVRPWLGAPLATACALALIWNPVFQQLSTQILSDVPGLALLLAALWLERHASRKASSTAYLALGLVLGLSLYVRTLIGLFVPALLCARLTAPRDPAGSATGASTPIGWPVALALALPIVLQVPWIARSARAEVTTPTEQVYLHSYATALLHVDAGDPGSPRLDLDDWIERTRTQATAVLDLIGGRLREHQPGALAIALTLVALAFVGGLRRRDTIAWLGAGLFAVLSTYVAAKPRLILPLFVLLVVLALRALSDFTPAGRPRRFVRAALALLLVGVTYADLDLGSWHAQAEKRQVSMEVLAGELADRFEPEAPLAALNGWHLGVFVPNPVYSLGIVANRSGVRASLELLDKHAVEGFVILPARDRDGTYDRLLSERGWHSSEVGRHRLYTR